MMVVKQPTAGHDQVGHDPVCYGPCFYTLDGNPRPFGATRALCDWSYKSPRALTRDKAAVTCRRCLADLERATVARPAAATEVMDSGPVDPGAGGVESFRLQRRA